MFSLHVLLQIMTLSTLDYDYSVGDNAPVRTEDPDNQTNDIAKGVVSTGRDARTVPFRP